MNGAAPEYWQSEDCAQQVKRFLQTHRSPHTVQSYARDITYFLRFLKLHKMAGNDIDALLDYKDFLVRPKYESGAGMSPKSINRKFAVIRSFLNWLQTRGRIDNNPASAVKTFRGAKPIRPTLGLSDDEVKRMLDVPDVRTLPGLRDRLILEILARLGLRVSELTGLQGKSFIYENNKGRSVLTVRVHGKGSKDRTLPVPASVQKYLLIYMLKKGIDIGSHSHLFIRERANSTEKLCNIPLDPDTVRRMVKGMAKKIGLTKRITPHSFRATAVSNALDNGATQRAVMDMCGWVSTTMITVYDKRSTSIQDSAVHSVDYSLGAP